MVTVKNSFHGTAVVLRARLGKELTSGQIKKARKELCGVCGCTCGGPIGNRGPQDGFTVEQISVNRVVLIANDSNNPR